MHGKQRRRRGKKVPWPFSAVLSKQKLSSEVWHQSNFQVDQRVRISRQDFGGGDDGADEKPPPLQSCLMLSVVVTYVVPSTTLVLPLFFFLLQTILVL